jgi:DNA-binding transcriptional LysR family regulator
MAVTVSPDRRGRKRRSGVELQHAVVADLRQLTVLAAVVRHRSFTAAARELHVAQQAVSRTIATLEAELGVELVQRTTREVTPTAAGAALARDAERLAADTEAALERARELGGAPARTLRVGVSPALSGAEVARVLDALRDGLPAVQVDLVETRPRAVADQLRAGTADLVLARFAGDHADGLPVHPLGATRAGIAVPRGHRLARRRHPLALEDLAGERLLIWSRRSQATDWLRELIAGTGIEVVVSSVVGRDGLLDVGRGEALALWPAADDPRPDVKVLALEPPVLLPVVAVTRRGRPAPTVLRALDALSTALA